MPGVGTAVQCSHLTDARPAAASIWSRCARTSPPRRRGAHQRGKPPMNASDRSYRNGSTPTVLLVHGAFADASIWAGVIPVLLAAGLDVVAPSNPLRSLAGDAAYLASVAAEFDGP